jgi:hypothetical protein
LEHIVALPQYDVLAYLIAGLAAIAVCDLIFGSRIFFRGDDWGVSRVTILIVVGYIAGHVISVFSAWVIEDNLIGRSFGPPTAYLMNRNCNRPPEPTCGQKVVDFFKGNLPYMGYFAPLECTTQAKVDERLQKDGQRQLDDGKHSTELFWHAYNTAKQNEDAFERIVTFHQEYNFSRNIAFVALLAALAVFVQWWRRAPRPVKDWEEHGVPDWMKKRSLLFVIFLLVGAVLFARYLYFYRAHSIEVLTSYGYGVESNGAAGHTALNRRAGPTAPPKE